MIPYIIIIMILIGIVVAALGVAVAIKTKGKRKEPDYRAFFMMGAVWLPFGIVFYITSKNIVFLAMGLVFFITGLANKDKWKKPEPIPENRKKIMISLAIGTALLVLLSIIFVFKGR